MEFKAVRLDLKALDEEGIFEGRLSVYGNIDDGGDIVHPAAFQKTLQERGASVPLLWQHDTKQPIGVLQLVDTPEALIAKGKLVLSVRRAREAYDLMKAGAVKGLSIGYRTIKQSPGVNGARRVLNELALEEGSLVTLPMNREAQVTTVKQAETVYVNDLETLQAFTAAARELREYAARMKG